MVQSNMVRPLPSTISSTSSIIHQSGKRGLGRGRGVAPWLVSLSAVLFMLCIFLLAALVLVAKRDARESSSAAAHNRYFNTDLIKSYFKDQRCLPP